MDIKTIADASCIRLSDSAGRTGFLWPDGSASTEDGKHHVTADSFPELVRMLWSVMTDELTDSLTFPADEVMELHITRGSDTFRLVCVNGVLDFYMNERHIDTHTDCYDGWHQLTLAVNFHNYLKTA